MNELQVNELNSEDIVFLRNREIEKGNYIEAIPGEFQKEESHQNSNKDGTWEENFKRELFEKFRQWLEKQNLRQVDTSIYKKEIGDSPYPEDHFFNQVDLFSLFCELTALKHETKLTSRNQKSEADQCQTTIEQVKDSLESIQREQGMRRKELTDVKNSLIRPILQGILDIRDRMEAGIKAIEKSAHCSWLLKIAKREMDEDWIIEGQKMTLRHLDRLLASYGVSPIESLGRNFDPFNMRAIEVENLDNIPNGVVLEEIRKGFMIDNEILRPAEVKVNRRNVIFEED